MALEYERLTKYLNFDLPEPSDIALYINGVGDVTDFASRKYQFSLQAEFVNAAFMGAQGSYGQVSPLTIYQYETLPAPIIAVLKLIADLNFSVNPEGGNDWDLPADLRPAFAGATLPNANLLGWSRAETLTPEQRTAYQDAGITQQAPINQMLMRYVAGMIENSKCKSVSVMSTSTDGTMAQIPYAIREADDSAVEITRGIGSKMLTEVCYGQASSHVASGSAIFRYRIRRRTPLIFESVLSCSR